MDDHHRPRLAWWRWLGWLITVLALGFIAKWLLALDHDVWRSLTQLRLSWLVGALGLFQLWFLFRFFAWEFIVKRHGSDAQRHTTLKTWTVSELMRYVPGNVWSFASKYKTSMDAGVNRSGVIQSLLIEALSQLSGAGVVGLLFFNAAQWWWLVLLVVALWPTLMPLMLIGLGKIFHWSSVPRMTLMECLGLLLWYMLVWVVFGVASAMIYRSFPNVPTVALSTLIGYNVVAWFIGYVSVVTPMGLGVREVSFVKLASGAMTNAVASLVSIITRLWFVLSEILFLGLVLLWDARQRRA